MYYALLEHLANGLIRMGVEPRRAHTAASIGGSIACGLVLAAVLAYAGLRYF